VRIRRQPCQAALTAASLANQQHLPKRKEPDTGQSGCSKKAKQRNRVAEFHEEDQQGHPHDQQQDCFDASGCRSIPPRPTARDHTENIRQCELNWRARLPELQHFACQSAGTMAVHRTAITNLKLQQLQRAIHQYASEPYHYCPGRERHAGSGQEDGVPAWALQPGSMRSLAHVTKWKTVQYTCLDVCGDLEIPELRCGSCGCLFDMPATAVGCVPNKPLQPKHWMSVQMLTVYHTLHNNTSACTPVCMPCVFAVQPSSESSCELHDKHLIPPPARCCSCPAVSTVGRAS
jgi:hypothetical protein